MKHNDEGLCMTELLTRQPLTLSIIEQKSEAQMEAVEWSFAAASIHRFLSRILGFQVCVVAPLPRTELQLPTLQLIAVWLKDLWKTRAQSENAHSDLWKRHGFTTQTLKCCVGQLTCSGGFEAQ